MGDDDVPFKFCLATIGDTNTHQPAAYSAEFTLRLFSRCARILPFQSLSPDSGGLCFVRASTTADIQLLICYLFRRLMMLVPMLVLVLSVSPRQKRSEVWIDDGMPKGVSIVSVIVFSIEPQMMDTSSKIGVVFVLNVRRIG